MRLAVDHHRGRVPWRIRRPDPSPRPGQPLARSPPGRHLAGVGTVRRGLRRPTLLVPRQVRVLARQPARPRRRRTASATSLAATTARHPAVSPEPQRRRLEARARRGLCCGGDIACPADRVVGCTRCRTRGQRCHDHHVRRRVMVGIHDCYHGRLRRPLPNHRPGPVHRKVGSCWRASPCWAS